MTHLHSTPHDPDIMTSGEVARIDGATLVIGNFDGVHLGHAHLLRVARAINPAAPVVALSFEPHPREFFAQMRGDANPNFRLTLAAAKHRALIAAGADHVVLLAFDSTLSAMTAEDFITRVLVDGIGCAHVVVGSDFVFGAARGGNVYMLRHYGAQLGFGVTTPDVLCDDTGTPYSSTRIRTAIAAGDFALAQQLLGRAHVIEGVVVKGDQRGRTLGYPTANQDLSRLQLPPYGIYAVRARIAGERDWRAGVANLGIRPMFELAHPILETHIFDFDADIYGKILEVEPLAFLRGEAKFDSLDALMAQMKQDCIAARAVVKSRSL